MLKTIILFSLFSVGVLLQPAGVMADDGPASASSTTSANATGSGSFDDTYLENSTFSANPNTTVGGGTADEVDIDIPTGFFENFSILFNGLLRFVIIIAALLTFVYLIWGSIDWITSGGDRGKTEAARGKLTSALIGLIVVASSYAILQIVLNFLGYQSLEDVLNRVPGM